MLLYICIIKKYVDRFCSHLPNFQSQMDISNEADIKGSPDGTKSNDDSGVETMEVDDKADSEVNTPVVERKEAEKRKRSSSR